MIDIDLLLAWGAAFKKLKTNETIFEEGSKAQFYHQLVSGSVRWVNINNQGKEFIQLMVEPGESFGELPLFDDGVYAANAIANEDTVIIRLHKTTFHQLIDEHPPLQKGFIKLMCQRLRFKFFIVKEMANHDPTHSISSLLHYLKLTKKSICPNCDMIKLTRQQIANMTGLRVETVIRTIKNLQAKGEIIIQKGKVFCTI